MKRKTIILISGIAILIVLISCFCIFDIAHLKSRVVFHYFISKIIPHNELFEDGIFLSKNDVGYAGDKYFVISYQNKHDEKQQISYLINEDSSTVLFYENIALTNDEYLSVIEPNHIYIIDSEFQELKEIYEQENLRMMSINNGKLPKLSDSFKYQKIEEAFFENTGIGDYTFLQSQPINGLSIDNDDLLLDLELFPIAENSIYIKNCNNLTTINGIQKQSKIQSLSIINCPNIQNYDFIDGLTNIQSLNIEKPI